MKLIVGLGNPGTQYALTRHNAGFMAVDFISNQYDWKFKKKILLKSWLAQGQIGEESVFLAKPHTYMNLSGQAFRKLIRSLSVSLKDVLVVLDDLYLPLGQIRLRAQGNDGGHNGLKSILEVLGHREVPRLRIGIGTDAIANMSDYVLEVFREEEQKQVNVILKQSAQIINCWIQHGIAKAMSLHNK